MSKCVDQLVRMQPQTCRVMNEAGRTAQGGGHDDEAGPLVLERRHQRQRL